MRYVIGFTIIATLELIATLYFGFHNISPVLFASSIFLVLFVLPFRGSNAMPSLNRKHHQGPYSIRGFAQSGNPFFEHHKSSYKTRDGHDLRVSLNVICIIAAVLNLIGVAVNELIIK